MSVRLVHGSVCTYANTFFYRKYTKQRDRGFKRVPALTRISLRGCSANAVFIVVYYTWHNSSGYENSGSKNSRLKRIFLSTVRSSVELFNPGRISERC